MTCSLKEVTFSDLTDLIREANATEAFLPERGDGESFLYNFLREFEGDRDCHFFALLKDRSQEIGFIVTLPHQEEGTLSIGPLYIGEQYRGMGFGRRLVEELIRWAKAREIRRLFTRTWGGNIHSRRIFEGLLFQLVKEVPDTRINGDSTVQYLLQIDSLET